MTVLELMERDCIFSISKDKEGDFVFTEACDDYYSTTLKKDEVLDLAEELKRLAGQ